MDASVRKDFYRALLKDYLAFPRTILISSHHLEEIEDLLENVLLLKDGQSHLHMPISELKEWAIGIKGSTEEVLHWTSGKKILYRNQVGKNGLYAVIKNDFTESELTQAHLDGLDLSSVSSSDLCVYLTSDTKGGIDDVFREGE